ncbi:glycosyltransferase family 4 protein [candidate division KSB1 bacterium]|nr:glycosyltransferase family 4 protein [candidate division KSB1 bacterium]
MRILYITQYFPPEVGATQTRAFEMAKNLTERGHRVVVLTEFPNHPVGIIPKTYRGKWRTIERYRALDVVRSWVFARPRKTFATRMGFYLSFMLSAAIAGMLLRGKFDVVLATSPPFFVGLSGLFLSRFFGCRFVFEIRDLWPRSAVELGELQNPAAIRLAEKIERLYYRKADRLIAVTEGIQNELLGMSVSGQKIELIRNGTNTSLFRFIGDQKKIELGLQDKFVVLYAGILGIAQGMETLCRMVQHFKLQPDVHFIFIGAGPMEETVKKWRREWGLDNLTLTGQVPREEMPEYLSAADCCLVPLKKNPLFLGALPSKMFDCLACERPVILSVDGEARRVLDQTGAGIYAEPENTDALCDAVGTLKSLSSEQRTVMGRSGRRFVERHFSRRSQALDLEYMLRELVET